MYNRDKNLVAITPSGIEYFEMKPEDIVITTPEGDIIEGDRKPSSELGMHLAIYHKRADVNAVVHTHSKYASVLACMGWEIEPVHYLIGLAGKTIRCAEYATYGTQELVTKLVDVMDERNAVLLSNHGLIAWGPQLEKAFATALHLEYVSELNYLTRTAGEPKLISDSMMDDVMKKFNTYSYK